MQCVKGEFDVKVTALDSPDAKTPIGRLLLDKRYHGALDGTSLGQMLAVGGPSTGSGGYVAIEVVEGSLEGKRGTFALQHFGSMEGSSYSITVQIVPGSGTAELAGLAGTMKIVIEGGKHYYELAYTLKACS
jgi:hypothetical protein